MRVGVDLSPLCEREPRGVARAVRSWLEGFATSPPGSDSDELVGFIPEATEPGDARALPDHSRIEYVETADPSARRLRGVLPGLVRDHRIDVFLSPWSAFPRVDVPVVVTVHELPFVRCGPVEGRLRAWSHRRWLARDVREAAAIVVPSHATRDDVLRLHPAASPRLHVVPHGFAPERWGGTVRRAAGEPLGVLLGATHRRKGVDVWLAAVERLEGLGMAWWLAGAPTPRLRDRLAAVPRTVVCEHPADDAIRLALASATLLVYPSLSEGFGFPPLEAMAAGVPVVATTAGSIPEVCGDAALLVPSGDPEALASAIRRVVLDEDLREDLVAKGLVRCRAFPPARSAARIMAVLRRVHAGDAS